jgi:tRNA-splicing endonuclease subunit Sen2
MNTQDAGSSTASPPVATTRPPRQQKPNYRHIHRFPLPVAVHPLPPLIPHNPLSVISVLLSYFTYLISAPKKEMHSVYFDSATSSIHVTDEKAIRALWEMGFFGKGSLSRSEPSWLEREKKKRGLIGQKTSEEITRKRREERREMKLERARKEQEAIMQQLKVEAANGNPVAQQQLANGTPVTVDGTADASITPQTNGSAHKEVISHPDMGLTTEEDVSDHKQPTPNGTKTVRFSPIVEKKEIPKSENASTNHQLMNEVDSFEETLTNEEHLQLSNEETFFLVYGLGAVQVFDDASGSVIPTSSLLNLFAQHSTFQSSADSAILEPDNQFLISYVAYHHFRSLGWIVRSGVKFGVDYLLYNRGPVFAHAEFALLVLPSYEHPFWSATAERRERIAKKQDRSWWWLHGVNRVQAHVMKTLVLCFVDIPPPSDSFSTNNIGEILRQYKVREMIIKRWTPNRARD